MSAASLSISHYRWRTDTGGIDAAPTWGAAVDTAWNITNNTGFMIAFCVQNAGTNASSSTTVKLQVSRNGGAFTDVTTSSTVAVTANVSSSADQTAVAVSEVAGTGSFGSGKYSEIGTTAAGIVVVASGYTNFVYGVSFNATQLFNGDRLQFKIVTVAGTSITATTIPTITFTGGWLAADYDWELPIGRGTRSYHAAIRSEFEVTGSNQSLLTPPAVTYQPQAPVILAGGGARRASPDYVVSLNLNLTAVAPPADTTNIIRAPLVLKRITRWRMQPDPTPSAIFEPVPFQAVAWPNPQRRLPPNGPLLFSGRPSEAVAVVTNPFVPVTWANPQRLRDALSAQIQPHRVAFSGLDTFFGAPGQVPTQAWVNPRGPQHPIDLRTYIQQAQIGPPPVMGRNNYDWPNPSFKARGPSMAVMTGNVVYVPVVTPPDTGQRHNLPFWATPGRLRSM